MKKISIIVPIYNVEKYLRKCLDSLINQSFEDYEILCINDGSTDNSQNVIDEYVEKYPNLIYGYIKENGGLSDARNYGLKKAKGDYVLFVDSDDYLANDSLDILYKKVCLGYDIVVFNFYKVWDDGKKIACYNKATNNYKDFMVVFPMATNKIFKRSLFDDEFKFKKGTLYEDLEFIPSLVLKTNRISFIDDCLYFYYQRESSIMNQSKFNRKFLDIFTVLESLENRFIKNNKYDDYKEELEYLNVEHLLYSAGLRFVQFEDGYELLLKCIDIINNKYKNFKNNKYYKEKSFKFKLICNLTYHKHFKLLKYISKLRG